MNVKRELFKMVGKEDIHELNREDLVTVDKD
jgi:hypothetical protein